MYEPLFEKVDENLIKVEVLMDGEVRFYVEA